MSDAPDRDYVLGTHDPEIARLGVQHAVWRERALSAWRRAGIKRGHVVVDLGCGPGYATLDLAEIVGPTGRVIAVDRSRRFLDALTRAARARDLRNIETVEADVEEVELPAGEADLVWTRWLLIFAAHPEAVVARVAPALRPGGAFVIQEYLDYATWRLIPESRAHLDFVNAVIESWRANGGDASVGRRLLAAFGAAGLRAQSLEPVVYVVRPDDFMWTWLTAYIETGPDRLVELGFLRPEQAEAVKADWAARAGDPDAATVTPMVLEAIARRPR